MADFRNRDRGKESTDKHAVNEQIRSPQVMVIGLKGEQLGPMITREAIRLAFDNGVDLVEVAPTAKPPVCKLLDYGKLKYREQKKAADTRKKTAVQEIKELRVRYNTDKHDLETKLNRAKEFIADGDKVRFQMRFKGREMMYRDLGELVFNKIALQLDEVAIIEEKPHMLGTKMGMTFAPKVPGQVKTEKKVN